MFAILCVSNVGQGQRRMNASYLLFSHNSEHVRNFRANTLVWQIYFWTKQQQKMHKIENKLLADVVHERIERIECNFVVRWSDLLFVRFSVVVCFFAFFAKSTWQSVHWTSVNAIARERTSKYYTGRACERIRRNEKKNTITNSDFRVNVNSPVNIFFSTVLTLMQNKLRFFIFDL